MTHKKGRLIILQMFRHNVISLNLKYWWNWYLNQLFEIGVRNSSAQTALIRNANNRFTKFRNNIEVFV